MLSYCCVRSSGVHALQWLNKALVCAVNDVANVNIDAKLIRSNKNRDREGGQNTTADLADTIELANGCACAPCFGFSWAVSSSLA